MDVASLKTWHWVAIGLLIGAICGGVRLSSRSDWMASPARTIGQEDFERGLLRTTPSGQRALDRIVVHPKESSGIQWVTALYTQTIKIHSVAHDPASPMVQAEMTSAVKFRAPDPYVPLAPMNGYSKPSTVLKYLEVASERPTGAGLGFQYAWYELPVIEGLLWLLGCTALIGGAWPPALRFLLGAGWGPQPEAEPYDLSKFHSNPDHAPVKATATADEQCDALLALIEANEREMAKRQEEAEQTAPTVAKAPAEVRQLIASAAPPAAVPMTQAEKDFAGEFYPTETHAHHPVPRPEEAG